MNAERQKVKTLVLAGWITMGLAPQFLSPTALAQTKPAVELEGAIAKEQVTGDLKTAIGAYRKIAANSAAPRDVRAKALLHLAGCYEKQGQQAQSVYQQIVRDYADQPAAKQASAKLAAMRQAEPAAMSTGMTQRKIEAPASLGGFRPDFANTDGRHALYKGREPGTLISGDLVSGENRVILKLKAAIDRVFASRDMSMAFLTFRTPDGKQTNAVVRADGTGFREIPGDFTGRPDWSWDNRYVLVCQNQPDGSRQPVRVSAADGQTLNVRSPGRCIQMFSPDGAFIASAESNANAGPIYVGPSDGSEQKRTIDNAKLMGWTRDGRYLAVALDRSGSEGLYLLPMEKGQPSGDPMFVRYGSFSVGQVIASGALVYESTPPGGLFATWLGTVDSDGRLSGWKAWDLSGSSKDSHAPTWSPDSSRIAYVTSGHAAGQTTQVVHLRNVASGEDRELYQGGSGEMTCVWAAQQPSLFCGQMTGHGTTQVLSVSTESGRAEEVGSVPGRNILLFGSRDDRSIYMGVTPDAELVRWEIATQLSTKLGQGHSNLFNWVSASPDGRWITRVEKGNTEIRPVSGGEWKVLVSGGATQIGFTPDGNWLLYHRVDGSGTDALFRVATVGGRPERLGDFPVATRVGLMWVSPDGRKIIADTLSLFETWVLENFEPRR